MDADRVQQETASPSAPTRHPGQPESPRANQPDGRRSDHADAPRNHPDAPRNRPDAPRSHPDGAPRRRRGRRGPGDAGGPGEAGKPDDRSSRRRPGNGSRDRGGFRPYSPDQLAARRAALPRITYPEQLPVSARRAEIADAIRDHQVVIVAGETGSGKTTQIPKICLELGRGITGTIGHTQPRRIAARTVAERIAEELGVELGGAVGYQVRFTDQVSSTTLVKLMTDGILLAEVQRDPELRRYDTLIIDEAHERSLNIDFILGYLANLLPRRPDLKVVITSATIDAERFAAHFGSHEGDRPDGRLLAPAPVVEVSGRTYPVEIRYRPLVPDTAEDETTDDGDRADRATDGAAAARPEPIDQVTGILQAADELMAEGPGDVLVFLSGEREIRDTHVALAEHLGTRYVPPGTARSAVPGAVEVVPLYARLSAAEQHRVFEPHTTRRVVLATNVAETSLTVPGIRYVIDPGTARISRYSSRTKVQRLPIEPISRASANQRSGRCGRVADGVAIRLYSEADFRARPEFTEPEILRTSLAAVILQMAALGLGDVARFPFVDPPDTRAVRDGVQLLHEIGALDPAATDPRRRLTDVGRQLAQLPIDPRLGRMLLAGQENGCAAEVMVIVAALSVQDVRERPAEHQQAADERHRRFTDPTSDFLAYLNLWRYLRTQQRDLSGSAFRRMCRAEYLNYLRVREWQDVVAQLRQLAKPLGLTLRPLALPGDREIAATAEHTADGRPDPARAVAAVARSADAASADAVHRALLVGLLSNLGSWDERRREYAGTRGTRFTIWPGSGLARRTPAWVMAAELVETSRLFARTVARIQPEWVEPLAGHLVRRTYSEPYWSTRQGAAMVKEKVLLYGLTLVADRPVLLGRLGETRIGDVTARELAREMFIRHALVGGEWRTHHQFYARNAELLAEAAQYEHRARHRGLVLDEDGRFDFYDERIPDHVVSARHFDSWWKQARRTDPDLLTFTMDLLVPEAAGVSATDFPDTWHQGDLTLPLTYQFEPGTHADGVTVHVPVAVLGRLRPAGFDWMVPGLAHELATATIRSLPKQTRVQLVPAPDVARQVVELLPPWAEVAPAPPGAPSYHDAFAAAVRTLRGVEIPEDAWDEDKLPDHLRMTFRVLSERGAVLAEGKDLVALQRELAPQTQRAVSSAVRGAVRIAMEEAAARAGRSPAAVAGGAVGDGDAVGHGDGGAGPAGRGASAVGADRGATQTMLPEQENLTTWPDLPGGVIPRQVESTGPHGLVVRGYPALVEVPAARGAKTGPSVALRVLADAAEQERAHKFGLRRLVLTETALSTQRVTTRWTGREALTLAASPYPSTEALVADVQLAAVGALVAEWTGAGPQVREADRYAALVAHVRATLEERVHQVIGLVVAVLDARRELDATIKGATSMFLLNTLTDVRDQVARLVYPGFVSATPPDRLVHLPRYLRAAQRRIERAQVNVHQDEHLAWVVGELEDTYQAAVDAAARSAPDPARDARLEDVRWMLEELRVSFFAQQLGTPVKVSEKRVRKALAEV
ncbi:ATP-dependent RNA helicase HrpA [Georgenia sp. TF02-10]|uniref:ATP-dependent RNA helicase HrpA n=1 Tax=Georgenia sp. TF02-10 TaxID=2917725 RepID=UPI001FA8004A|nr:ATP-dependent RNA helicase HrpA [Georgenia sp. TF02-10]UNX55045.1 ATP-dependent RNA helicase HrpA [Georgenia sp. TF02-10]